MNPNKKSPKIPKYFNCETCDYFTCNKKDFNKHEETIKHKSYENPNFAYLKNPQNHYSCCHCGKIYKHASTLSAHKKKCIDNEQSIIPPVVADLNNLNNLTNLVIELVKSNTDLQKQMLEVCKAGNTNSNNTNNSHNKTFNMQFFLNEQCKDAMNISEFMDSFQLQFADLERIGEIGYVDGISDIIIKRLNEMDIYKRPIHCSDTKRDIMYVRAENVWEKETNGHDRLRLFIKQITHKNIKLIPLWAETHPQAKDHEHPLNDNYLSMVSQAMGGRGNLEESENKIIKRIAKTVYIDKYQH
jgi:hypothetical protein